MFKSIFITTLISTTLLIADNSFLGKMISKGTQYQQVKKHKTKKIKKFKKDNHKYNKRYRNFDYDRYGYYNDDGFYFGYFDRDGYFFNNLYFEYNSRYTYRDRYYRRGYFAPSYHHNRVCNYNNEWNRVHRYREPNIIVYGNYYENYQTDKDKLYYIISSDIAKIYLDRVYYSYFYCIIYAINSTVY